jgi:hypothetical protein
MTGFRCGGTFSARRATALRLPAGVVQAFPAAQNVVITATGGNFNGTGAIEVTVHYFRGESD